MDEVIIGKALGAVGGKIVSTLCMNCNLKKKENINNITKSYFTKQLT
jgi:hypothetical protein